RSPPRRYRKAARGTAPGGGRDRMGAREPGHHGGHSRGSVGRAGGRVRRGDDLASRPGGPRADPNLPSGAPLVRASPGTGSDGSSRGGSSRGEVVVLGQRLTLAPGRFLRGLLQDVDADPV